MIHHGIPWLGKKAVEMGRYYGSEALRNPKLQKKAIDYALDKLNPMIQNVGSQALDQLSTKIRPKRKYKTDRKNLDGAGIIDKALKSGVAGSPWQVDYKKGFELMTDPNLFKGPSLSKEQMKENVKRYKQMYNQAKENGYKGSYTKFVKEIGVASGPTFTFPGFGGALYRKKGPNITDKIAYVGSMVVNPTASWGALGRVLASQAYKGVKDNYDYYKSGKGVDIHNAILKVAPKKGFVLPGHRYTGPGNPLEKQVRWDDNGNILHIYEQPTGKTDAVSMQHDVDYSICSNKPKADQVKCKNDADRKMVKALDAIPWKDRQWGHAIARNTIATKAKLGLGIKKTKNGKGRRVKKIGKKN